MVSSEERTQHVNRSPRKATRVFYQSKQMVPDGRRPHPHALPSRVPFLLHAASRALEFRQLGMKLGQCIHWMWCIATSNPQMFLFLLMVSSSSLVRSLPICLTLDCYLSVCASVAPVCIPAHVHVRGISMVGTRVQILGLRTTATGPKSRNHR